MLFLVATVILQIVCVAHVIRSGSNQLWLLAIMLLPIAGSLAYVVMEVVPRSRR